MLWLFQVKRNQRNVNCWVLFSDDNFADEATRASSKVDISSTSRWIANKIEMIMLKSLFIDFYLFSWFLSRIRSFTWACCFINRCREMYEESEKNGLTSHELRPRGLEIYYHWSSKQRFYWWHGLYEEVEAFAKMKLFKAIIVLYRWLRSITDVLMQPLICHTQAEDIVVRILQACYCN